MDYNRVMEKTITFDNGLEFSKRGVRNKSPYQFKKKKYGITFYINGYPKLHLVANRWNEFFFVSCGLLDNGKISYSFSTCSTEEKTFGLPEGIREGRELAKKLWESYNS